MNSPRSRTQNLILSPWRNGSFHPFFVGLACDQLSGREPSQRSQQALPLLLPIDPVVGLVGEYPVSLRCRDAHVGQLIAEIQPLPTVPPTFYCKPHLSKAESQSRGMDLPHLLAWHASSATRQVPGFIPHCHSLPPCLKMMVSPLVSLTLEVPFTLHHCTFLSSQTQTWRPCFLLLPHSFSSASAPNSTSLLPNLFYTLLAIASPVVESLERFGSATKASSVAAINRCLTNTEGSYCLPSAPEQWPVFRPSPCGMYEMT